MLKHNNSAVITRMAKRSFVRDCSHKVIYDKMRV